MNAKTGTCGEGQGMPLELVLSYDRPREVSQLFTEYTDLILRQGEDVKRCLEAQQYRNEILELEEKYGLPAGRLYLAYFGGEAAGCIALKRTDNVYCEMKRLYVRPGYRGKQIGAALIERVIEDARTIGYKYMRLDTFSFMERAVQCYRQYGFYDIERYNDNPALTALYMQLDLKKMEEPVMEKRVSPARISRLEPDEIFVFGSNLAGRHGGGAARLAMERWGAVWGFGIGLQGQTYAIPTMQGGVDTIRPYVTDFIEFAGEHPDKKFLVTEIGCGIAGFTPKKIAPLFRKAMAVENIYLPERFWEVLEGE